MYMMYVAVFTCIYFGRFVYDMRADFVVLMMRQRKGLKTKGTSRMKHERIWFASCPSRGSINTGICDSVTKQIGEGSSRLVRDRK